MQHRITKTDRSIGRPTHQATSLNRISRFCVPTGSLRFAFKVSTGFTRTPCNEAANYTYAELKSVLLFAGARMISITLMDIVERFDNI